MTDLTELYQIGNFIDTFALGHYARVFEAYDLRTDQPIALKIMRPEHLGEPRWESEAFLNEAELLDMLADLPSVMKFYDCGYIASTETYPSNGEIQSFGRDLNAFRAAYYASIANNARPYLALEPFPREHNLLYVMKSSKGEARRLPTEEGLDLALQFGELLYTAHQRGIVYLDHKLEHVYWDGQHLTVIDWNSSKRIANTTDSLEQQIINDLHNLCVGILYPVFTGKSPVKGSLRPQPGAQHEVEARYEGIANLDFSDEPTLSSALKSMLDKGAQKKIYAATNFLAETQRIAVRFGWSFAGQNSPAPLKQAREHARLGLKKLRDSQIAAREARELLLEAATLDGINDETEAELRRILAQIGDFLNNRVIP